MRALVQQINKANQPFQSLARNPRQLKERNRGEAARFLFANVRGTLELASRFSAERCMIDH